MNAITAYGLGKAYQLQADSSVPFNALNDISFSIEKGESVGIIGRNGAGKSTLLKVLAGITFPSSGKAEISGSFSSLIEVGTGFHPDLSGRENILLNGSILGISRREIATKVDEIISFSGVEKFIDEPLRTYSSGMKLRLAFSVIAHLPTDIIALDEVLAVGDSMFQLKCLEKIFSLKKEGKTILFVSHNMSAIKQLCERTLVLNQGAMVFDGSTETAVMQYFDLNQRTAYSESAYTNHLKISVSEENCLIDIALQNLPTDDEVDLGININGQNGACLYHFSNRFSNTQLIPKSGKLRADLSFKHQLKPGRYPVSFFIGQNEVELDWLENAVELIVEPGNPYGFYNPDAIQGPIITEFTISSE